MKISSNEERMILHIDMDHFFSAIEEREHPEFKGKPVVVGADPKEGRGRRVVKTCNYEAREFGVHSGMPISRAWQLCPNAIYARANYQLYKEVSRRLMLILRKYSDKSQQWGLDEAFLDISSGVEDFEEATQLAISIKYDILWNERLTCSIGIASNKLVAKIASDFEKPDGLTVVRKEDAENFLAPLPVRKMLWIGKKTEHRLNKMGIRTIGDLAAFDVSRLVEKLGVMGRRFHQWAHGIYLSEVENRKGIRKSIGHQSTFAEDTYNQNLVLQKIDDICPRICERASKYKILFKTVTVRVRYSNFETLTHGKTLPFFTNCIQDLQKVTRELTKDYLREDRKIRLVGVRVSNLRSIEGQAPLNLQNTDTRD